MRLAFNWLPIPLTCLGFLLITGVVIFIFLKSWANKLQQSMRKIEELENKASSQISESSLPVKLVNETAEAVTCPACGGKNPQGTAVCAYCGRKIEN
jgi:hypothetical protein